MSAAARAVMGARPDGRAAEARFYARYRWCINPILSVNDVFLRIAEELGRYDSLELPWQRAESRLNVYLLACAVACAVEDYLGHQPWELEAVAARFPVLKPAVAAAAAVLNAADAVVTPVRDRVVARWKRRWDACVDSIAKMLAAGSEPDRGGWEKLRAGFAAALDTRRLPRRLLERRTRMPEGFRSLDMAHQDVMSLVARYDDLNLDRQKDIFLIGARTAGPYFVPLAAAVLRANGYRSVTTATVRPKRGLSYWERTRLRTCLTSGSSVVLIDDHPATGGTFARMVSLLRDFGVRPEEITILAPGHPAQANWTRAVPESTTVALPMSAFHKQQVLEDVPALEAMLSEWYSHRGWQGARIEPDSGVDAINADLEAQCADGFQVRLKRVFAVTLKAKDGRTESRRVLAKSVGWGWLGYHSLLAGERLEGLVPRVIGLRHGLLFMEWTGQAPCGPAAAVAAVPRYVAARVRRLGLSADPCFGNPEYGWTGWDILVRMLRGVYVQYASRLKQRAVLRRLGRSLTPVPTLVDGQMRPAEWLATADGVRKVDFEQHGFGGAEPDVADPAYDLAGASFEFSLSDAEERTLVNEYIEASGDRTIASRLPLYKLLYGTLVMRRAAGRLAQHLPRERSETWNERYCAGRAFLIHHMNRHLASRYGVWDVPAWSPRLFFLDLDGVLDSDYFGFPHTTPAGLEALAILRSNGHAIVLNSGRPVQHIRDYCRCYGFPGGIAEYGSVFFDAVEGTERPLIGGTALVQLAWCREELRRLPGVFLDPGYVYSVRAHRHDGERPTGLQSQDLERMLPMLAERGLSAVCRPEATYIVARGADKGSALAAVRARYGGSAPVAAMGDTEQDLPMLEAAEIAYMPANHPRAFPHRGKIFVMKQPRQRGLLAAVRDLARRTGGACGKPAILVPPADVIDEILQIADLPPLRQYLHLLRWRGL